MTPYPPPYPPPYPQGPPPPGAPYGPPPMGYYPGPMPYYPPPMMMAPVMVGPPGQRTFNGLKWLRHASTTAMAYNGLGIAVGVLSVLTANAGGAAAPNPNTAFGALLIVLAIVFVIIGFIAFLFGVLGFYNINEGKREFGDAHLANVGRAVRWFAFGAAFYLAAGLAATLITVGALFQGRINPAQLATQVAIGSAVSGAILVGFTYCAAQVMQHLVAGLMTRRGRDLKQTFVLFSMVGVCAVLGARVASAVLLSTGITTADIATQVGAFGSVLAGVAVFTAYLYRLQVIFAEAGARNMIASGQYDPDAPAPGQPPPQAAPATP